MTRPLFLLGSKRSGTSHLVSLLNAHPNVFVTNESDVIWLLYQHAQGLEPRCYDWDGPLGMEATLNACRALFAGNDIRYLYFRIQRHLLRHGSSLQPVESKTGLIWIGDKKPVQHADPRIHDFIREHFPGARFIHLVRHPRAVVGSMLEAGRYSKVDYWRGSRESILRRWVTHEKWVDEAASQGNVLTVRFEDLTFEGAALSKIFEFLDLDRPPIDFEPRGDWNSKYDGVELEFDDEARRVMERYGYA